MSCGNNTRKLSLTSKLPMYLLLSNIRSRSIKYSNQNLADVHFVYGRANGILDSSAVYRNQPDSTMFGEGTFAAIQQRNRECDTFCHLITDCGAARYISKPEEEENVLDSIV